MEFSPDDCESGKGPTVGYWHTTVSKAAILQATLIDSIIRFMVDEFSDLYFDPSPLREHEKEAKATAGQVEKAERLSMPPPEHIATDSPQMRRTHSNAGPLPFSPRHQGSYPQPNMGYNSMNRVPSTQFYGNGDHGAPSPMRMGSIGMPMGDIGGMGGVAMGGMGGMGSIGIGSPDVRRSMRRGMSMGEDGFGMGGVH